MRREYKLHSLIRLPLQAVCSRKFIPLAVIPAGYRKETVGGFQGAAGGAAGGLPNTTTPLCVWEDMVSRHACLSNPFPNFLWRPCVCVSVCMNVIRRWFVLQVVWLTGGLTCQERKRKRKKKKRVRKTEGWTISGLNANSSVSCLMRSRWTFSACPPGVRNADAPQLAH